MLILFMLLGYALIFIVYVVIRLSLYRDIGDYPAAAIDKSILLTTIIRPSTRPSSSGPQPGHHHPALNQATIIRLSTRPPSFSVRTPPSFGVLLSNRGGTPRLSRGVSEITDLAS